MLYQVILSILFNCILMNLFILFQVRMIELKENVLSRQQPLCQQSKNGSLSLTALAQEVYVDCTRRMLSLLLVKLQQRTKAPKSKKKVLKSPFSKAKIFNIKQRCHSVCSLGLLSLKFLSRLTLAKAFYSMSHAGNLKVYCSFCQDKIHEKCEYRLFYSQRSQACSYWPGKTGYKKRGVYLHQCTISH